MNTELVNWPTKKHRIILTDPPWSYLTWSERGSGRSASQHYVVQNRTWIKSLPMADIAAPTCILFCWITWPNLPEALEAIEAWGFTYKTCGFVWVKTNRLDGGYFMGNGRYSRSNSEACIIATRGPGPFGPDNLGVRQIIETDEPPGSLSLPWWSGEPETIISPAMRHSRKPDTIHERIDQLYHTGDRVELFARRPYQGVPSADPSRPAPGWWTWGNEIPGGLVYTERAPVSALPTQLTLEGGR